MDNPKVAEWISCIVKGWMGCRVGTDSLGELKLTFFLAVGHQTLGQQIVGANLASNLEDNQTTAFVHEHQRCFITFRRCFSKSNAVHIQHFRGNLSIASALVKICAVDGHLLKCVSHQPHE